LTVDYDLGPVGWEAKARYAAAFVGLNWSSLKDLNARVFELLAMGKVAICNEVPDLTEFFVPDRDLLTFTTLSEAIEKVMWVFDHPGAAADIAGHGHCTVKPYTWDARIDQIIKECL
jgi:spore maturation protein CgeB